MRQLSKLVNDGETVDDLQNGLYIIQKTNGFKFGVDAVLLADFAKDMRAGRCADLCTGSGIVPLLLSMEENRGKVGVFTGIDKLKFRKQVTPGDTLRLEAELITYRHKMGKASVKATVDGEVAAMGEISFAVIENAAAE